MATKKSTGAAISGKLAKKTSARTAAKSVKARSAVTGKKVQGAKSKRVPPSSRVKAHESAPAPSPRKAPAPRAPNSAPAPKTRSAPTRRPAPRTAPPGIKPTRVVEVKAPATSIVRELERVIAGADEVTIREGGHTVRVAGDTLTAIKQLVNALGSGPLTLIVGPKSEVRLTSQETAELLNVSRPHVVKLARESELPCTKVGNRHRFLLSDVEEYDARRHVEREAALAAMAPKGG